MCRDVESIVLKSIVASPNTLILMFVSIKKLMYPYAMSKEKGSIPILSTQDIISSRFSNAAVLYAALLRSLSSPYSMTATAAATTAPPSHARGSSAPALPG
jgi:hypothetical protein